MTVDKKLALSGPAANLSRFSGFESQKKAKSPIAATALKTWR
jgi:hypothetical protein